jgi:cytochrome P450
VPSPELIADPYDDFALLRRDAPVYGAPGGDFVLSRREDVVWALRHPELFSSMRAAPATRGPEIAAVLARSHPIVPTLMDNDAYGHAVLRKITYSTLNPGRLKVYEPRIKGLAETVVDGLVGRDTAEFVSEFAAPLPMMVILDLMGAGPGMTAQVKQWAQHWTEFITGTYPTLERGVELAESTVAFQSYVGDLVDERRARPQDDIVTELARARDEQGAELDTAVLVNLCRTIIFGATETTAHMLANTMELLVRCPEEMRLVEADTERLPAILEESLRAESPVQWIPRWTTGEIERHGVTIPRSARVLLLLGAANRDESSFSDTEFLPGRQNIKDHVAFGHGAHFCLGAPLARVEGRIAFATLLARLKDFRSATDERSPRAHSAVQRAPRQLFLAFGVR